VAVITTIFSIVIHTMTAFVFARFPFKGRKTGLLLVMILQMFPSFMGLTALYMVALNFGMLNNLNMLVIIYVAGGIPQNIWLVRGFMLNIPKSMDEAAYIDGVTKLQLFFKIILPLSLPIIFFIAVTSFMGPWMDYMLPRYLINMNEKRTLAIGLFDLINGTNADFAAFCAGAVLIAIPITALYMVFQRFLLEGLMAGANKGE
jgi:arabinogalactan oligomer/maltooligosaccharide transport system permease protein